ncbi:MAG: DNA translocase FtsK 4TM domain-containing protein [Arcobacteraceae bacterium]
MLNKILSLIAFFVIIYFEFSIFVLDKLMVGQIGFLFSQFSHNYFGYISYIYLFIFVYILYKINFKKTTSLDLTLRVCTLTTLLFSFIIFQTLILEDSRAGILGNAIVLTLSPFIGNAGLWIFMFIGVFIFLMVFLENKKEEFSNNIRNLLIGYKPKAKIVPTKDYRYTKNMQNDKKEDKITIKEVGDTAEIVIEVPKNKEKVFEKFDQDIEDADIIENDDNTPHALMVDELEENKKLLDEIELGKNEKPKDFKLPSTAFFQEPPKEKKAKVNEVFIDKKIADLLEKLLMFKIEGDVVRTYTGPIVTTFEFKPAPNVKVSKILNLQDDLAMALKAQTIRIQAPIPGKDVVGIEVPNEDSQVIYIRELLESEIFQNAKSPLTMILGKDIVGKPFITDLKKLPHLLIAGTTGSGKSVGLNCMILSLLYKNSPDTLRLIMIDPKMLEFSIYNDIPHLLTPVITRPTEAINALSNMVSEMERRYTLMSQTKTKNIENYNEKAVVEKYDPFPYIVVIIDELADLMMTSGKEVELSIARLAQMARASGIHLIVATQRPSVDVVTGLIKANLPSRISYKVGQRVDSKIILDSMGAESLLGRGDMLFTPPGMSGLVRLHAPWSTEVEIEKVADFLKEQRPVQYDMQFVKQKDQSFLSESDLGDLDELYEEAKQIVLIDQKSSISYLQRKLRIGYNRAATIVEQLEKTGVLSEANIKGNRDILI